jgi:hypothetical protein
MTFKEQVDANIKVLSQGGDYNAEDQALLAGYSAKLYQTEFVRKIPVE